MTRLKDLRVGGILRGLIPGQSVTLRHVEMPSDDVAMVTYVDGEGKVEQALVYRDQEQQLELVVQSRPLSFSGEGDLFRLVSEAQRLRFAFLFDPLIAVSTSAVDPLPHQITAVYEEMLPRQPLRFLLADDPGAGKTIMAGLLMKELIARGDLQRCLVVCPGSLAEQWQDELYRRFNLPFEILTNDKLEAARTGNWFFAGSELADGTEPDIVTLAKALGSGIPVGACLVNDRVSSKIKENDLGTTFGGGMIAMAAVLATLEAIENESMIDNAKVFEQHLRKMFSGVAGITAVHGKGCLLGIEFEEPCSSAHAKLLARNIITGTSSNPKVLRLLPPLSASTGDIDLLVQALNE